MLRADQQRSAALRASPSVGGRDVTVTGDHSSDESEALSPPASPTHLAPDTRYGPLTYGSVFLSDVEKRLLEREEIMSHIDRAEQRVAPRLEV